MDSIRGFSLVVACLLISVWVAGCLDEESDNEAPVAKAAMVNKVKELDTGKQYKFTGKGSTDPDGDTLEYFWDFDDNVDTDDNDDATDDANKEGKEVAWTYYKKGTYTITLTVTDGSLTSTDELVVKVAKPEGILNADLQTDGDTRQTLGPDKEADMDFDGSGSENSEGGKENIVKHEWDFSYDSTEDFVTDKDTKEQDSTSHSFETGRYIVVLRITNSTDYTALSDGMMLEFNFNRSVDNTIDNDNTPQSYDLPVNTLGAYMVRAELQYDAGFWHDNDLDLVIYNATGEEVARNETHDTDNRQQSNTIELEASDDLFDEDGELGEWQVDVEHQRSTGGEAEYELYLDVFYYY